MVQIVVAWELCWYRYEVDLAEEGANGVRAAGQGYELTELEPHEHGGQRRGRRARPAGCRRLVTG